MDAFPNEILVSIFLCFTPKEICETLSHVNKRFYLISNTPHLWAYFVKNNVSQLVYKFEQGAKITSKKNTESWKDVYMHRERVSKNWRTGKYLSQLFVLC
jgi:hypothetical protein